MHCMYEIHESKTISITKESGELCDKIAQFV
jgi:hypothetical protein